MSNYRILKDFKGSQDGRITEQFLADTECYLSDSLAPVVVAAGWAEPVKNPEENPETETNPSGNNPETEQPKRPKKK